MAIYNLSSSVYAKWNIQSESCFIKGQNHKPNFWIIFIFINKLQNQLLLKISWLEKSDLNLP